MKKEEAEAEVKCEKDGCTRMFKTPQAMKLHTYRAHGGAPKRAYRKGKNAAIPVIVNFCSACGSRIPNAHVVMNRG